MICARDLCMSGSFAKRPDSGAISECDIRSPGPRRRDDRRLRSDALIRDRLEGSIGSSAGSMAIHPLCTGMSGRSSSDSAFYLPSPDMLLTCWGRAGSAALKRRKRALSPKPLVARPLGCTPPRCHRNPRATRAEMPWGTYGTLGSQTRERSGRCWRGKPLRFASGGWRATGPTLERMIERGRTLVPQEPRDLRRRVVGVFEILEREAPAQLVDDLDEGCTFGGQPARESSDADGQRFGDRLRVSLAVRQQPLDLVLDRGAD